MIMRPAQLIQITVSSVIIRFKSRECRYSRMESRMQEDGEEIAAETTSCSAFSEASESHRFLLAGIACLDIINVCPRYPAEDDDMRAVDQEWRRGGNSSNSSCVLTQLPGSRCSLLATLPSEGWETEYVEADLERHLVNLEYCARHENCRLPTSYVVLSQATGSRTIVHYRKLPNLVVADFARIPLQNFSWIHFEARNVEEVEKMIECVEAFRKTQPHHRLTLSVEVEKKRPETYPLLGRGDVVFVSKDVALELGCDNAEMAVKQLHSRCRDTAVLVCAWGSRGADAYSRASGHVHCDAFPPASLVDTLSAGDTFNAGVMYALESGASLADALRLGCWLAGRKCGQMGGDDLLAGLTAADPVYELLNVKT